MGIASLHPSYELRADGTAAVSVGQTQAVRKMGELFLTPSLRKTGLNRPFTMHDEWYDHCSAFRW